MGNTELISWFNSVQSLEPIHVPPLGCLVTLNSTSIKKDRVSWTIENTKMEIYQILPEGERNNFDPEEHLTPRLRQRDLETSRLRADGIDYSGSIILHTIRVFKLTKVKNLIAKCSGKFKEQVLEHLGGNLFVRFLILQKFIDFDEYALCAIKYLANDGFIKLKIAERFEDSEVVQFYANAVPDFRDGKFQL